MLKLICVTLALVASANAKEARETVLTWGRIFEGQKFPAVSIESSNTKTDFTWNGNVNPMENPLRATLAISYTKGNQRDIDVDLDDVCANTKKGSNLAIFQNFVLKVIANQDKCPIKEGTKATFPIPYTFKYSSEATKCGPIRLQFKVFKKNDKSSSHPIMTGTFRGNVTGC